MNADILATALEESNKTGIENTMREVRKNINDLQYEWDNAVMERAQLAIRHAATLNKIAEAHQILLEANIQHIEAESDIVGLKLRNASIMQSLEEEREKVQVAKRESDEAKRQGQELGQIVSQMLAESEEQRAILTALQEGKTAEQVQMEADAEEAKLELIQAANPNVMRDFERRATEIARLKKKMEGLTEKLSRLTEQTETIMGKWEPKLDELVSLINDAFAYNFEQISCAGEIRVHKDDDFEQWALDIMVKFRYISPPILSRPQTSQNSY
jgi:structural maintenance of chromosomes protein 5